jgi:DNA-binding transcriptional ArsR family regulator
MENAEEEMKRTEVFDALSHPTRITILKALDEEVMGFAELKKKVKIESNGHLQHHLSKLDGLIKTDVNGKYGLSDQGKDALLAVQTIENRAGGTKRKGKRVNILWLATALIAGSLIATLSDITKQNPWLVLYIGVVLAWILLLTAMATTQVRGDTRKEAAK